MTTALLERELAISLVVTDAVDAAARLLNDAQRFGLAIRSVHIEVAQADRASIRLAVKEPQDINVEQMCARLARHHSVVSIQSEWVANTATDGKAS